MARTKPAIAADVGEGADVKPPAPNDRSAAYTVVARRYRPQRFEDVVGQDHVVQALRNAIRLNRVTHAYLFSGTRGVGKTSLARIFAKCLNCVKGPTDSPCNACDICEAISAGQDVDVIEIDGASNNGVEQVRELRQNAGLRPSRSRYKIYYIDEVHMLTTGAFNALLKTLEEPPEHVKFFFATTEPNKIPITVLSRCQRFDFAGIAPEQIIDSLAIICGREGVEADRPALQAVARRASGSMRDAQSLLEQLLSFGGKALTGEMVHQALGLAPDERVLDVIDALADQDPARALTLVDDAANQGVQPTELLTGLLEFLRDLMVVSVGAEIVTIAATPAERVRLRAVADRWPLDSILAALQILAEARLRLRGSAHGRLLVELAICRIARLENFTELSTLIEALGKGNPVSPAPAPTQKKKPEPPELTPPAAAAPAAAPVAARSGASAPRAAEPRREERPAPLTLDRVNEAWGPVLQRLGVRFGIAASQFRPVAVEPPHVLVVRPVTRYNDENAAETAELRCRIEATLRDALKRELEVRIDPTPIESASAASRAEAREALLAEPLVQRITEAFDARMVHIDPRDDTAPEA